MYSHSTASVKELLWSCGICLLLHCIWGYFVGKNA